MRELQEENDRLVTEKVDAREELREVGQAFHQQTQQHQQLQEELWKLTEKLNSVSKEERLVKSS